MKDLVSGIRYDASNVISQAIGPSKEFCMGYLNPGVVGGEGYISVSYTHLTLPTICSV